MSVMMDGARHEFLCKVKKLKRHVVCVSAKMNTHVHKCADTQQRNTNLAIIKAGNMQLPTSTAKEIAVGQRGQRLGGAGD